MSCFLYLVSCARGGRWCRASLPGMAGLASGDSGPHFLWPRPCFRWRRASLPVAAASVPVMLGLASGGAGPLFWRCVCDPGASGVAPCGTQVIFAEPAGSGSRTTDGATLTCGTFPYRIPVGGQLSFRGRVCRSPSPRPSPPSGPPPRPGLNGARRRIRRPGAGTGGRSGGLPGRITPSSGAAVLGRLQCPGSRPRRRPPSPPGPTCSVSSVGAAGLREEWPLVGTASRPRGAPGPPPLRGRTRNTLRGDPGPLRRGSRACSRLRANGTHPPGFLEREARPLFVGPRGVPVRVAAAGNVRSGPSGRLPCEQRLAGPPWASALG